MKKVKLLPIKEMLFTFLAINKILYWFNTITEVNPAGLGDVANVVLERLLNRDLILIVGVVAFFFLDKLLESRKPKYSNFLQNVLFYAVGFVGLLGFIFIYNLVIHLISATQDFYFGGFMRAFINFLPNGVLGYLSIIVVLEVKQHFKMREKKRAAAALLVQSTEDKLALLKILLDDNILTQEEFDRKKEKLSGA